MSLETIAAAFALNVGVEQTSQITTSQDRTWQEMLSLTNLVGNELARRVDWGALTKTQTIFSSGTPRTYDLSDDFSRITSGVGVTTTGGGIVRPLTRAEWALLPAGEIGIPRYFLLEDRTITFWPHPFPGEDITVSYQSENWAEANQRGYASDETAALIDEDLILLGLIVRWRRQKGMDYADYEAEYEATLLQLASFDDRSRL